jgi:hypothetical protein
MDKQALRIVITLCEVGGRQKNAPRDRCSWSYIRNVLTDITDINISFWNNNLG